MAAAVTRADLVKALGSDPKVITAFEENFRQVAVNTATTANNVAATDTINNATVVVLSPNDAFGNERVLAVGNGIVIQDNGPGNTVVIALTNDLTFNGGYRVAFNLFADTNLDLPVEGKLATTDLGGDTYANDAAAAAGGVAIGELYRQPLGVVAWRQA